MSNLPADALMNILSRLPVNSLLRFKCVSKPWCALIEDPDFIKMNRDRTIQNSSNLTLILGGKGTLYSICFDSLDKAVELDTPFKNSGGAHVLGSCNGLLLLLLQERVVTLFNPLTRKYWILPATPVQHPKRFASHLTNGFGCNAYRPDGTGFTAYETYGFGYDSINDDYKVIKIEGYRGSDNDWTISESEWNNSETKVYSLKSNSWRKIQEFPYCLPHKRMWNMHVNGWGVLFNGALHTVVDENRDPDSPILIVALDIGVEEYYLVPLPDFSDPNFFDTSVEVLGGRLCFRAFYTLGRTDIWVMKDYRVRESWINLFSVVPPIARPCYAIFPLAYSENRSEILLNCDFERLIWYDLKRDTVKNASVRGLPFSFYAALCVGSLVPLNGNGKIDAIKIQHEQEKSLVPLNGNEKIDALNMQHEQEEGWFLSE